MLGYSIAKYVQILMSEIDFLSSNLTDDSPDSDARVDVSDSFD